MSDRIRGQETTLQVTIDGQTLSGSFGAVEGFKWSPRQDLTDSDFIGEPESEPDIQHHGYDMSFTIHERENSPVAQVLLSYVAALEAGTTLPDVTLTFVKRYRDPSVPPAILVFPKVKLKMDSQEAGDRKGYMKSMFSAKCRKMRVQ